MRVIAGAAKGVPLAAPKGPTRPTTDRAREAVFSVLGDWAGTGGAPADQQLTGLGFLDLFAGSGAMACEAASRGADPVVGVDSASAAVRAINANAAATGLAVTAVRAPVAGYLAQPRGAAAFDIVWLDPPYEMDATQVASVLAQVAEGPWLAPGGLVALERSARRGEVTWPMRLAKWRVKRYGDAVVTFGTEA